tara:strand:- start:52 stop:690 length:639 start_codon:yes stop_codon:yes gene_type:complete
MKRFERKYIERKNNSYLFKNFLLTKRFHRKYQKRIVNSLYFDDLNFSSYKDNVDGNTHRLKTRIRWYNDNSDFINLEIKNKNGFLGWKDTIKLKNIYNIEENIRNYSNSQLENNLKKILKKNMFPIIKTKYLREYYEYGHGNIRATIDTQVEFFSIKKNFKINFDKEIMEFKYPVSNDQLFRECIIPKNNFRFQKFSKYVVGVSLLSRNLLV